MWRKVFPLSGQFRTLLHSAVLTTGEIEDSMGNSLVGKIRHSLEEQDQTTNWYSETQELSAWENLLRKLSSGVKFPGHSFSICACTHFVQRIYITPHRTSAEERGTGTHAQQWEKLDFGPTAFISCTSRSNHGCNWETVKTNYVIYESYSSSAKRNTKKCIFRISLILTKVNYKIYFWLKCWGYF